MNNFMIYVILIIIGIVIAIIGSILHDKKVATYFIWSGVSLILISIALVIISFIISPHTYNQDFYYDRPYYGVTGNI